MAPLLHMHFGFKSKYLVNLPFDFSPSCGYHLAQMELPKVIFQLWAAHLANNSGRGPMARKEVNVQNYTNTTLTGYPTLPYLMTIFP